MLSRFRKFVFRRVLGRSGFRSMDRIAKKISTTSFQDLISRTNRWSNRF